MLYPFHEKLCTWQPEPSCTSKRKRNKSRSWEDPYNFCARLRLLIGRPSFNVLSLHCFDWLTYAVRTLIGQRQPPPACRAFWTPFRPYDRVCTLETTSAFQYQPQSKPLLVEVNCLSKTLILIFTTMCGCC